MDMRSRLGRSRAALLVALGVDNFGSGLFLPLSIVYATRVIGVPLPVAGVVVSVSSLVGLLVPPLAGRFVDRVGPRAVVITSQLMQAGGTAAYFLADGVPGMVVGAVLLGSGQRTFYSALFALIADVADDGPKDRSFAVVSMVRSGAFGLGSLTTGVLLTTVSDAGLRVAVCVNTATLLAAAGLLTIFVHPRVHHARTAPGDGASGLGVPRGVHRDSPFVALIVVTAMFALTGQFFLVGAPVYALEVLHTPGWVPGASLALLTGLFAVGGTLAVRATDALKRTTSMSISGGLYIAWSLASLAVLVLPSRWQALWLVASTLLLVAAGLICGTRANAMAEAAAPTTARGRYLAAFQYAFAVPELVAPLVVSLFVVGPWMPWLVLVVVAGLGLVAMPYLTKQLPAQAVTAAPLRRADELAGVGGGSDSAGDGR
jgi:MFS family permease